MKKQFEDKLYIDLDTYCSTKEGVRKIIPAELKLLNDNPSMDDIKEFVAHVKFYDLQKDQHVYKVLPQVMLTKSLDEDQIYEVPPSNLYDFNYMQNLFQNNRLAIYTVERKNFENPNFKKIQKKKKDNEAKKAQFLAKSDLVSNISNTGITLYKSKLKELIKEEFKKYNYNIDVDKLIYFDIGD